MESANVLDDENLAAYSSKDLLNRHLDISELVKRLMHKRRQQLDLQYVSNTC